MTNAKINQPGRRETGRTEPVDIEVTMKKIREKSMHSADRRYLVMSSKRGEIKIATIDCDEVYAKISIKVHGKEQPKSKCGHRSTRKHTSNAHLPPHVTQAGPG